MEKLNEKGKMPEKGRTNGIKERRLQSLRRNYFKPDISEFSPHNNAVGDCSDMASVIGCTNIPDH